ESRSAENLGALDRVAVLAGFGELSLRALRDGADARSEVAAVAQRAHTHAENRAGRKALDGDDLLRHRSRAGHLDAPADRFAVLVAHRLAVGTERHELDLGVVRLFDKARRDA